MHSWSGDRFARAFLKQTLQHSDEPRTLAAMQRAWIDTVVYSAWREDWIARLDFPHTGRGQENPHIFRLPSGMAKSQRRVLGSTTGMVYRIDRFHKNFVKQASCMHRITSAIDDGKRE